MTLMLKQVFAFLRLLNSDTETTSLAAGLALGIILGFSPILSLQALLLIVLCLFVRIQLGALLVSAFFFKFVAYLFDPLTDALGRAILETSSLRELFVSLYNIPLVPFTRFNNSIVMGSAAIGLLFVIPMFFIFRLLILKYRELVVARIKGTKWWKAMQATAFFKWYATYDKLYG
jgi:uncharacterized protein (TIGR03546 family)